jgi:nitrite reductase/ring-hydroxylating ferredoxin subunit/uncharacterized membrane protein
MVGTDAVRRLVHLLGDAEALDSVAKPVGTAVAKVVTPGPVKDVLSGTWLGHPLHPMLTDIPIGSWTSAFVLDLVGGKRARPAADTLIGFGVLTALPTAAAGLADWSDTYGAEQRIGVAHAAGNVTATALYFLSWRARRRGKRVRGLALSFLGAGAATAGAYLGGHLVYRKGVGADRNAWKELPGDWTDVAAESEVTAGKPFVADAGDDRVMLWRRGTTVLAVSDVCGHAGGPLHEGNVQDECVTCPWHGSTFRLDDGHVVHGPATGNQPAYEVKLDDGRVAVRKRPRV